MSSAMADYLFLDNPLRWEPKMRMPFGFNQERVDAYQGLIDRLVGTSRDQSIIKLVWIPLTFKWYPAPLGSEPKGYVAPLCVALWDSHGEAIAPPRWGLMERCEPEQYLPNWETSRWTRLGGILHDVKGPAPDNGMYTHRKTHSLHEDSCCLREGNETVCWGYYREPDQELLEWIGEHAFISRSDKEIQPRTPVDELPRSQSQLKVKDRLEGERVHKPETIKDEEMPRMSPVMMPKGSFVRSQSGLYLPEN